MDADLFADVLDRRLETGSSGILDRLKLPFRRLYCGLVGYVEPAALQGNRLTSLLEDGRGNNCVALIQLLALALESEVDAVLIEDTAQMRLGRLQELQPGAFFLLLQYLLSPCFQIDGGPELLVLKVRVAD